MASELFDINKDVIYVDKCPICGGKVRLAGRQSRLPRSNEESLLMGYPGRRWVVCHEGDIYHFRRIDLFYGSAEATQWEGLAYITPDPNSDILEALKCVKRSTSKIEQPINQTGGNDHE